MAIVTRGGAETMAILTAVATPDWVQKRGGELKKSRDGNSVTFYLNGSPVYLLQPIPARGKWACRILQTNNGQRIDKPDLTYASEEEALAGGLKQLQDALGW
jgi:hypothetical protein